MRRIDFTAETWVSEQSCVILPSGVIVNVPRVGRFISFGLQGKEKAYFFVNIPKSALSKIIAWVESSTPTLAKHECIGFDAGELLARISWGVNKRVKVASPARIHPRINLRSSDFNDQNENESECKSSRAAVSLWMSLKEFRSIASWLLEDVK
jgi:hypothetical protein